MSGGKMSERGNVQGEMAYTRSCVGPCMRPHRGLELAHRKAIVEKHRCRGRGALTRTKDTQQRTDWRGARWIDGGQFNLSTQIVFQADGRLRLPAARPTRDDWNVSRTARRRRQPLSWIRTLPPRPRGLRRQLRLQTDEEADIIRVKGKGGI